MPLRHIPAGKGPSQQALIQKERVKKLHVALSWATGCSRALLSAHPRSLSLSLPLSLSLSLAPPSLSIRFSRAPFALSLFWFLSVSPGFSTARPLSCWWSLLRPGPPDPSRNVHRTTETPRVATPFLSLCFAFSLFFPPPLFVKFIRRASVYLPLSLSLSFPPCVTGLSSRLTSA